MLKTRILTALWGIPLLVVVIWFSEPDYTFPLFTVFASIWGLLAAYGLFCLLSDLILTTIFIIPLY
jgi:hypothetical protein